MTGELVKPPKGASAQSDLSQVMAHGPAYREAYGRLLGAILMLFAIAKTRRGPLGIATLAGVIATFYHIYWK